MTAYAADHWERAKDALRSAEALMGVSFDGAASRAYYAAFHAVSALFAAQGREFTRHTAVQAAVHRDLVRAGVWPAPLGEAFTYLLKLRETGDYGGGQHVSQEDAGQAIQAARDILAAVSKLKPEDFLLT